MPSRPDLRDLASNVKEAFADADRETLLEVLTFVIKEYVVEGPPPMLIHQAETLADLRAPSFAQLVTALQSRFDHPELSMLVVDGEQVSVRVGNAVHPLLPARQPIGGTAADVPRPQVGVHIVETTLSQRPAPAPAPAARPAAPAAPGTAPPPRAGLSVRSQPAGAGGSGASGGAPAPAAAAPAAAAPPAAPSAAPSPPPSDKPESSGDDASARFSLLELD